MQKKKNQTQITIVVAEKHFTANMKNSLSHISAVFFFFFF